MELAELFLCLNESWQEHVVQKVWDMEGVSAILADQCMFGLRDPQNTKLDLRTLFSHQDCPNSEKKRQVLRAPGKLPVSAPSKIAVLVGVPPGFVLTVPASHLHVLTSSRVAVVQPNDFRDESRACPTTRAFDQDGFMKNLFQKNPLCRQMSGQEVATCQLKSHRRSTFVQVGVPLFQIVFTVISCNTIANN